MTTKNISTQTTIQTNDIGVQCNLDCILNEKIKLDDFETIIFPGGFMKGYAYIGFVKYIKERLGNKKFKNIIGVSIGSVFSLGLVLDIDI